MIPRALTGHAVTFLGRADRIGLAFVGVSAVQLSEWDCGRRGLAESWVDAFSSTSW